MNVPLDRDVPDKGTYEPDDESPVDVPKRFIAAISKALEIARNACRSLLNEEHPKRSAVEFWCDTVGSLERVLKDIEIVTAEELEERNGR